MYNKIKSAQIQATPSDTIIDIGKAPSGCSRYIIFIILHNTLNEPQRVSIRESDFRDTSGINGITNNKRHILTDREIVKINKTTKYSRLLEARHEIQLPVHIAPDPSTPIFTISNTKYIAIVPEKGIVDTFIQYIDN